MLDHDKRLLSLPFVPLERPLYRLEPVRALFISAYSWEGVCGCSDFDMVALCTSMLASQPEASRLQ